MNREQLFLAAPKEWINFSFYTWWLKCIRFLYYRELKWMEKFPKYSFLCRIQTSYVFLVHVSLLVLGPDSGGAWYPSVWDVMLCRLVDSTYRRPEGCSRWSSDTIALLWDWAHWRSTIRRNIGKYFPVDATWPSRRRGSPVLLARDSFL
jgi:hypothetical protein